MASKADSEEGMNAIERGRFRYKQKDYNGALEAFSEAVASYADHMLLTALDSRAATYEKLGQLMPALRDGKTMIETKPKMSKGYLRTGKILQLQGKEQLALQIYARGLAKVASGTDKERQHLVTFHEKLRQALKPGESKDFIYRLPLELALIICQNLPMRDRVVCLAVSKGWKNVLESSTQLWTTLDTTHARRAVSLRSIKIHLRRSNYTLDRAIITLKAYIDAEKMKFITRTCKNLRELHITGNGVIGDTLYCGLPGATSLETISTSHSTEIPLHAVQSVLKACHKSLVDIKFLQIRGSRAAFIHGKWTMAESLKTIHLKAGQDACLDFDGLRDNTPNASSVVLTNWKITVHVVDATAWKCLERLDLTDTQLSRLPKFPPTLKHLVLSENPQLHLRPDDEKPTLLPLLETFACASTSLDGEALKIITAASIRAHNLKRLTVGDRMVNPNTGLVKEEFPPCETLEELSLASMILNDRTALEIVSLYPNVKRLDISATHITGVAVKAFVNMGLKWLRINECDRISADAVEWARGKDIEIIHNLLSRGIQVRGAARFADSVFGSSF
ncbi:hypothetical protein ONS95_003221 [Cadophora gregata]|uniref:uncharacterized protein n=1 Tax=Cadophora gregata TaxID=51156 RepID=UPI0026DC56E6|nr:uncharacterized protein ONS95_003221 [Cadophora gregata]KAK0108413.1 hypothetical protein ONS95_003221 [Cadophora gregata]